MWSITPAEPSDTNAIAEILEELDRFYSAVKVESLEQRSARIGALLFRDAPVAYVLLARDGEHAVGLAAYSFLWPAAGTTHSLYLKELYVKRAYWRQGVGNALMRHICKTAIKAGCSRVEWTTETTNAIAQQFYEALRAPLRPEKVFYRLEGDDVTRLANPDESD